MEEKRGTGECNVQKSFQPHRAGTLFLVATPIGNLEDMTFRAVRILKEVDVIAAEDTRQTRKLLSHFDISTRLTSYHEHNKKTSGEKLIEKLQYGDSVALVSDAGLPAISDPGNELVRDAVDNGIPVVPVPGANAALSALIVSGFSTQSFSFYGFLPRDKKNQSQWLELLKHRDETLIFYESPHRIVNTLKTIYEQWGNRNIAVARELTKKYEEVIRGDIHACLDYLEDNPPRGEYCVVIEGVEDGSRVEKPWWSELSIEQHVAHYEQSGIDRKQAIKNTAADRGIPKREVYQLVHRL
mgnify:CR=1 FL=1